MWLRKYLKDMMSSWVNSIFRFSVQYVNLLESLCIMSESLFVYTVFFDDCYKTYNEY